MQYREIEGDLVKLALAGEFDVIAHGCNCFCQMGAGLAPQMAKAFKCDKYSKEDSMYKGSINKLGTIDYETFCVMEKDNALHLYSPLHRDLNFSLDGYKLKRDLVVVNAYTQYKYGKNHADGDAKPLDYEALTLCLRKMNHTFKGTHIGLPLIGCHLAGGVFDHKLITKDLSAIEMFQYQSRALKDVKTIIQEELKDCKVTVVHYKP